MMMERYPNLKEEVGGLNLDFEIYSLPDEKFARWSTASSALTYAGLSTICTPLPLQKTMPLMMSRVSMYFELQICSL
jgi:hypothetical protein